MRDKVQDYMAAIQVDSCLLPARLRLQAVTYTAALTAARRYMPDCPEGGCYVVWPADSTFVTKEAYMAKCRAGKSELEPSTVLAPEIRSVLVGSAPLPKSERVFAARRKAYQNIAVAEQMRRVFQIDDEDLEQEVVPRAPVTPLAKYVDEFGEELACSLLTEKVED